MPSIEALKDTGNRAANVRKALHGVAFVAPISAEVPEAVIDESSDLVIPAAYLPIGLIEKGAGFTVGRELSTEQVEALGYGTPIRIDATGATQTIGMTALETNAVVRGLVDGIDLSSVTAGTNGSVEWEHPDIPPVLEYRLLVVTADGAPGAWIYEVEFLPRAQVTTTGDVTKNQSDAQQYEITFTGLLDDTAGFARKSFMGGAGFDASAAGFGS